KKVDGRIVTLTHMCSVGKGLCYFKHLMYPSGIVFAVVRFRRPHPESPSGRRGGERKAKAKTFRRIRGAVPCQLLPS
ncbi:MAG: hypothetical protein JW810_07625, partial [Sedimentisphaerales bacterium]|nr:hypothetical protein [Sedimentisphaerales bacterium]